MIEDKEVRWVRYMTQRDPFLYRKYDYLVGLFIDNAQKLLPKIKFSDCRTESTLTCEAKYNWFRVRTSEDGVIEELIDLQINE